MFCSVFVFLMFWCSFCCILSLSVYLFHCATISWWIKLLIILLLFRCLSGTCTARGRNTSSGVFPSCCGSWRALYVRMTELTYVTARTVGLYFWFLIGLLTASTNARSVADVLLNWRVWLCDSRPVVWFLLLTETITAWILHVRVYVLSIITAERLRGVYYYVSK